MFQLGSYLEYIQKLKECEYIVCIGAGKRLERIKEFFDISILEKIKYVADNSTEKQGKEIDVAGQRITVCPVSSLCAIRKDNVVVIITPANSKGILEQLEEYEKFRATDILLFAHIEEAYVEYKAMNKYVPENLRLCNEMLIPKTIHYCWFGRNPLPERYKKWMDSWKRFCPDYEIIEWNEDNYDVTKNKYMKQAYKAEKWGFVPDYARLDIIYHYGGIYLDTDVELVKSLDDLLYQEGYIGFESDQYVNLGLGFGAVAGNALVKGMRDEYEKYSFIDDAGNINLTVSPFFQTRYLMNHELKINGEYQILGNNFVIYPEKVLNGSGYPPRNVRLTPNTYSVHHYDGSWLDAEERQREEMRRKEKGIKV